MELRVNDYIRTKKRGFQPPQIARIKSMNKDSGYKNQYFIELDHNLIPDYEFHIYKDDIGKSSSNIMDLIEVGDYVNGEKVIRLFNPTFLSTGELPYVITNKNKYEPQEIKSIVTKEMYSSVEYRVETN